MVSKIDTRKLMGDVKFLSDYAKQNPNGGLETWDEAVDRVMDMHTNKYPLKALTPVLKAATKAYKQKLVFGSQRALQFGGDAIIKKNAKIYNCAASYVDRPEIFKEYMWLLLNGCGVGFSVQNHHIAKLPTVSPINLNDHVFFKPEDSIEGWADCIDVLMASYFDIDSEFKGKHVVFDFSEIRPKGAPITGGFLAPGPEPLRNALDKIAKLLNKVITEPNMRLNSITIYDVLMHLADAVISGGVRRSATICLFSKDDMAMRNAKTGNWFIENPQRARSNNSVVLLRNETTQDEFNEIIESVKGFGEPGFIWTDDLETLFNPCVSGDTLVLVKDHGVMNEGEINSDGVVYEIPMRKLVELYETSSTPPMIVSYNTTTKKVQYDYLDWAALTRKNADLIELELNNGKTLKLTPDHKVWTENRGWIEAVEILQSDNLLHIENGKVSVANMKTTYYTDNEDVYDITVRHNHNFFANGLLVHNCVEAGLYGIDNETGLTGFSFCNLTEINGAECTTEQKFYDACYAAAILGTLQAGYTNFDYLHPITKKIVEREALLGVSITGWMNNPHILFDERILKHGVSIIRETNINLAKLIGINPAARLTVVKPSGNVSVLAGTASGIHGDHAPRYFRGMQMNKESPVVKALKEQVPEMVTNSVWSANQSDYYVSFPIVTSNKTIFKHELMGIKQLEYVVKAQQFWVLEGNNPQFSANKNTTHSVSNTIQVDDWDGVAKYIYENRNLLSGVSLIGATGDKDYNQAPFTEVLTAQQITNKYGDAALFASGLITRALDAFGDLWVAINEDTFGTLNNEDQTHENVNKKDWLRMYNKFTKNYFNDDKVKCSQCLKDVYLLHKWNKITKALNNKTVDLSGVSKTLDKDVDTMTASGCYGGVCEI